MLALLLAVGVVLPQSSTPDDPSSLKPVVAVQSEDYREARAHFATKLLRKQPAPQPWPHDLKPPEGVTEIEYRSGELSLKAWVTVPADASRKHPAILYVHGGFAFGSDDWETTKPFRSAGFVVLAPILRGENGQPGAFTLFYDEVDDVLAAGDYLGQRPYVDQEHLFVAGSSAGGTLALLASMASERFKAAASFSASPDQALLVSHAKIEIPFDRSNPHELEMRSPLAFAASLKCPARIYYGTRDNFVLTSRRTAELAREADLDVEAIAIEGDHESSIAPGILKSIEFFKKQ
jgi:dipeptidyl aminopeptidase/acylaminoacyl peptidase